MDSSTLTAILVPSVLSVAVTVGNLLYNRARDEKRSKEKAWELAEKLTMAAIGENDRFLDANFAVETTLHFNLAYRAALLVRDNNEEGLRRLLQQFPAGKLHAPRYMPDHLESRDQSPEQD